MAGPLLELHGVRREYASGAGVYVALDHLSLRIDAGELIAIVGASGSGKSTLMNILGCLDRPTAGTYRVAGQEVSRMSTDERSALRRERFGFVFQRYNLLPDLTAVDNVAVPAVYAGQDRGRRRARATALLTRLKLQDHLHHRPNQLSGGQQQRVSIARALMNGGEIILADEPTGALDSQVGEEVLAILKELHNKGHTVVLVTHDPKVAAHAERRIELKDGRILSDCHTGDGASHGNVGDDRGENRPAARPSRSALAELGDRFGEALHMALLAMNANRARTFLTMLGIIIGIASVASIVAIGQGGQQRMLAAIRGLGTNTISVFPGGGGDFSAPSVETLTPQDAQSIARQGYIDSVTPSVTTDALIRFGNVSANSTINGVGEHYFRVYNVDLSHGRFFSPSDIERLAQVVVLNANAREKVFNNNENPVGEIIFMGDVPFRVIGVAKRDANLLGTNPELVAWVPYTALLGRLSGQRGLKSITARVSDEAPLDVVAQIITKTLVRRHGREDFHLFNTDTVRRAVENTTQTLTLLVSSIALISLIVGGIGVMNIMLVSVTERTREIGVRTAVGARRSDILWQFLTEAVLVCLVGGALGVCLAFSLRWVFAQFVTSFQMIFSASSIVAAIVTSTLVGVVFGFLPARNAARLDPVEALARRVMERLRLWAALIAIVAIEGCTTLRTHYVRPAVPTPATYAHADEAARAATDQWWRSFNDPRLNGLVDEALHRNNDLAAAALRVREAQLAQHLVVINPTVTAGYTYERSQVLKRNGTSVRSHAVSVSASYVVDLWGQLGAVKDAAAWEARATEEDRQSAAVALVGSTVGLYFQIAELNQRVLLGERSIAYASKTLDLVKALALAGAATKLEIAESEQNLESQRASQTEWVELRVEVRNALTVVLDGHPWPEASELARVPTAPPPGVDAGLPASLLGRRPDLRAAEMRLRGTLASTDATRLSFYPQVSLTGTFGALGGGISDLLDSPAATVIAALNAPFIQVNQAHFSVQLARTQYEEAKVGFRQVLLTALYDVDNALSSRAQLAEEGGQLERSLQAAQEVERIYGIRYRAGAVALRFWLDAQQTRREAEVALAANRLNRLLNYSTLCQALGGGTRDF